VFKLIAAHIKAALENPGISGMDKSQIKLMADKFNEYWHLVEPISIIPMLLDPRVKLDLVVGKEPKSVARNLFSDVFSSCGF
jgi:hypothetical protein